MRATERRGRGTFGDSREARALIVGLTPIVFLLGYGFRPDSMAGDRSGFGLVLQAQMCSSLQDCISAGFPGGLFGLIRLCLPVPLDTVGQWDFLFACVGCLVMVAFALWFSRYDDVSVWDGILFLCVAGLSAIYIFLISKDVVQAAIFIAVFLAATKVRSMGLAMGCVALVFVVEGALWRSYFLIIAILVPVFFLLLRKLCWHDGGCDLSRLALWSVLALLVFAVTLQLASPSNYAEVVSQHGIDREDYTSVVAASGIRSLIPVTGASPAPLFVANWVINIVRIMFPVELLLMGLYYWPFCLFQLLITVRVLGTLRKGRIDGPCIVCLAVYLAFVAASGAFEPDFGSWVRHETACFPFVIACASGFTGVRTDGPLRIRGQG